LKKCFKNLTIEQIILFVISLAVFAFAVYTFNENASFTSIAIMIFMSIFVIVAAINPNTLLNFILVQNKDGIEMRFNRHEATDTEIEKVIKFSKVEDVEEKHFNFKDLGNSILLDEAKNRLIEERSDVDFLLISTELRSDKEYENALRQAYFGLNISKNYKIKSLLELRVGSIYYDLGAIDISINSMLKAIEIDNMNANAYNNLGILLKKKNNVEEAEKMYRKAIEIDNTYFKAYFNCGVLAREKGDIEEAEKMYRKAIEINNMYSNSYNNLGVLLKNKGNVEEATKMFKKVEELKKSSK